MGDFERRVLQLVSEGKISAEEGEELLQARDRGPLRDLRTMIEDGLADVHRTVRDATDERIEELLASPLEASDEPLTLRIHGDYALRVQESEDEVCRVVWHGGRALFGSIPEPPQVRLEGRTLYVESRRGARMGIGMGMNFFNGAGLEVHLPAGTILAGSIAQRNGRVKLDGFAITVLQIDAQNGRVRVHTPTFTEITIESHNGSIRVDAKQGERLKIEAWNGRVNIEGAVNEVDVTTRNGGIEAVLGAVQGGRCRLHTLNGSVELELPSGVAADLRADTIHGPISVDVRGLNLVEDIRDITRRRLHGKVEGQAGDIAAELHSTNGAVRVLQRLH